MLQHDTQHGAAVDADFFKKPVLFVLQLRGQFTAALYARKTSRTNSRMCSRPAPFCNHLSDFRATGQQIYANAFGNSIGPAPVCKIVFDICESTLFTLAVAFFAFVMASQAAGFANIHFGFGRVMSVRRSAPVPETPSETLSGRQGCPRYATPTTAVEAVRTAATGIQHFEEERS